MARSWFGGTAADQVLTKYRFGQRQLMAVAGAVPLTFWDAETGGNQHTDLLFDGSVVQKITTDADGYVPRFQGPAEGGISGLLLDGSSGTYASTGDKAALDVTGDLEITVRVAPDAWAPSALTALVSKWKDVGSERGYMLRVNASTGALALRWSTTGADSNVQTSSVAPGFTDGTEHWVRVTLDVDNGASGHDVKFYTSDDGATWTQLGTTQTGAGTTSIHASTAPQEVGSYNGGGIANLAGIVGYAEVRDGIGGTIVADPDFVAQPASASALADDSGNTWTLNGDALLTGLQGVETMWADDGDGTRHLLITTDGAIDLSSQLSTRIPTSEKGAPDGVATLNGSGKIVEPVPYANVENVPDFALDSKVASYREGEENLFAGEGSAAAGDPDATAALGNDVGGWRNTALGPDTLAANVRGFKNTAVGYDAMRNNVDGYRCTAVGNDALRENIGGVGTDPVSPTDPGSRNTAVGDLALVINTTGYANTAVGVDAAQTNDTGDHNTAVGYLAYSGVWNQTTQHHKHADLNTAVGSRALHFTATDGAAGADGNTAVGANALRDNVTGAGNVAVGHDASATVDGVDDSVAIGARATVSHDRAVALGSDTATSGVGQVNVGDRLMEMDALGARPGNAPTGAVRLFAFEDAGKVRLEARFPSGNAQLIVAEP